MKLGRAQGIPQTIKNDPQIALMVSIKVGPQNFFLRAVTGFMFVLVKVN